MCNCGNMSGNHTEGCKTLNETIGLVPASYANAVGDMSPTEQEEYDALLEEAHAAGYGTVGAYLDYLNTQSDTESKKKASKLQRWISDGTIERGASTVITILGQIFPGLFGGGRPAPSPGAAPTPEDEGVPGYIWWVGGGLLALVLIVLAIKYFGKKAKN